MTSSNGQNNDNVVALQPYEVIEYSWGSAVKTRSTHKVHTIYLKPNGFEIDVEHLDVVTTPEGIFFNIIDKENDDKTDEH
jgi:hypothetical protein